MKKGIGAAVLAILLLALAFVIFQRLSGQHGADTSVAAGSPTAGESAPSSSSPSPASAPDAYRAVLQGSAAFYSTELKKSLNISQLIQVVTTDSSISISAPKFVVLDLDSDGTPEVVLWINIGAADSDNCFGFEILKAQDGIVYGYTLTYRGFESPKTDGTFSYSDSAFDNGFGTISFSQDTYSVIPISYCESNTDAAGNQIELYYVNQKSATEDDLTAAYNQQNAKPDVTWVSFTPENIEAMLSGEAQAAAGYTATYLVEPSLDYTSVPFDQGSFFSTGFAVVVVGRNGSDTEYGYLDQNGKLPGGATYSSAWPFDAGTGLALVQKDDGTYAFINTSGVEMITSLNGAPFSDGKYVPSSFSHGWAVISDASGGAGNYSDAVIDSLGQVAIPFDYTNHYRYLISGDVIFREKDSYPNQAPDAILDISGKLLFKTSDYVGGFENDVGFYWTSASPQAGLIDTGGNKLTGTIYTYPSAFHDGIAPVERVSDGKTGYIDTKGNFIFVDTSGFMSVGPPTGANTFNSEGVLVVGPSLYSATTGAL
ncbi:MAG: hypothetical protein FWC62_06770 [Firmicutes bacterium]|nr:hypothetical protein [Bacillota bacterium]